MPSFRIVLYPAVFCICILEADTYPPEGKGSRCGYMCRVVFCYSDLMYPDVTILSYPIKITALIAAPADVRGP